MLKLSRALLYFNTIRYLRPVQIYGRLWRHLYKPKPGLNSSPQVRPAAGAWVKPAPKYQSLHGPSRFRFLNEDHDILSPADWNHADWPDLWLYNLHYFDDLNASGADARGQWHRPLLARWVSENPPGKGVGWDPYPTSLRMVNWIKWALAGNELPADCVYSLAVQARWLSKRLETHLLGNHLFANAKALVFAGLFFEGKEAAEWLVRGLRILEREIPEQILPDGGHFERSTMYHALALEDVLDLCNIGRAFPSALTPFQQTQLEDWRIQAGKMLSWLGAMCHPDGGISFFNDAAFGVAPAFQELASYASRLGVRSAGTPKEIEHLKDSGYVRVTAGSAVAILDVAPVGPDYIPGHAHADTLSFELSLFGQRMIVNGGTSCYQNGPARLRERQTVSHSTVEVAGESSSEVWGAFRVARRAGPFGLQIRRSRDAIEVECSHDGYCRLPGKPVHRRMWEMTPGVVEVSDSVSGGLPAIAHYILHPDVRIESTDENNWKIFMPDGREVNCTVKEGIGRIETAGYAPEFGKALPTRCLVVELVRGRASTRFSWN